MSTWFVDFEQQNSQLSQTTYTHVRFLFTCLFLFCTCKIYKMLGLKSQKTLGSPRWFSSPNLSPMFILMPSRSFVMRPSSLGGGRILRRTLSVRLSVRPVRGCTLFTVAPSYERTSKIEKTSVFAYGPASRMYFSAREEGRKCPHIVRPSRPHKFCRATLQRSASLLPSFRLFDCMVNGASALGRLGSGTVHMWFSSLSGYRLLQPLPLPYEINL